MNLLEAQWLGSRLAEVPSEDLFPLLNVGSQSARYRTQTQPYIDRYVFAPLRDRGGRVWHLDQCGGDGIDIVGDICDPAFVEQLLSRVQVRSVLLGNILERVNDRQALAQAVRRLVPDGGYVLVSGPCAYPWHAEPVDTMYRPDLRDVAANFPGMRMVAGTVLDSGNWRQWTTAERGCTLPHAILRLAVPFYHPRQWLGATRQMPFLLRHVKAYAAVFQKQPIRPPAERIGVVVIGRNEGRRLARCLHSVTQAATTVVYVDSGSTDDSANMARSMGVAVVELDHSRPFTAARARNAGWEYLQRIEPALAWVQFVDGDCEITPTWWHTAWSVLHARPELAIVCGRIRERNPQCSVFTRLCDVEWDAPTGDVPECGGTLMARISALRQVGGFNPSFIAGEEPEMCVRLRQAGWKILRIRNEMAWHEAGMTRVSQWWRREVRGGYAAAEGAATHGHLADRHRVREVRRNWFWGLLVPLTIVSLTILVGPKGLFLLGAYLVIPVRTYRALRRRRMGPAAARLYAVFCTLGKFPQVLGQLHYWRGRLLARPSPLIEYKGAEDSALSFRTSVHPTPSLSKE
jgi:hypothetical protein